jgi:Fic family protein
MNPYIHETPDWPAFHWDQNRLAEPLAAVRHQQGRLLGHMEALGFPLQQEAMLKTLTQDVLKSSEIEGEILDVQQVRSSIARRLGIDIGALKPADRHVEGVVEMMLDATRHYDQPLTAERLQAWHASLFPSGRSGMARIAIGAWREDRSGPMQVVSGPIGRERVHFEAPAAARLNQEMQVFLNWFNAPAEIDEVLKAAQAHLWFVTIHPLDDGNSRIARAIADMALARSESAKGADARRQGKKELVSPFGGAPDTAPVLRGFPQDSPQCFYSMSAQIRQDPKAYYDVLETSQKGSLDITPWMTWFLACLDRAIGEARSTVALILDKARFWGAIAAAPLNSRQQLMINKLLNGFEGKLTTSNGPSSPSAPKIRRCATLWI